MISRNQKILIGMYAVFISASAIFLLQSILFLPSPLFFIISDSMVPTLQIGDVVVIEKVQAQEVGVGDIIAFKPRIKTTADILVHRVYKVDFGEDGALHYTTKGDANPFEDPFTVTYNDIQGRVLLKIPYIGRVFFLLGNPVLLLILAIFALRRFL